MITLDAVEIYICADGTVVIQHQPSKGYTKTIIERLCEPARAYLDAGILRSRNMDAK